MRKTINIVIIIVMVISILAGCESSKKEIMDQTYQQSKFVLGTIVSIQIFDHGSEELLEQIFNRIETIENRMSTTIQSSEVQEINRQAGVQPVQVSQDTYYVIDEALAYGKLSKGKFDVTIGPVVKLWGIGTEQGSIPSDQALGDALKLVDYNKIELNEVNHSVFLKDKGMEIELGGIAKGYTADEIIWILKEHGVKRAMINLGGNVYAYGEKAKDKPWLIGLQDPFDNRNQYFGIVSVRDKTVVTSGIYERYFIQDGIRYHHIFDTITGYPVQNEVASVSIISEKSLDADALSTILFSMGVDEGLSLVNTMDNIDCIYVTKDKEIFLSEGIDGQFELTNEEYEIKN